MAIDIIARGLASSLTGPDGKISSSKMPTLSAVPQGTTFYPVGQLSDSSLVAGKTAEEILLMMLYGIVSPTLTNPYLSIALSDENKQLVIGRPTVLKGALSFNRGAIDPAYGTSGYRVGAPTSYSIGDITIESENTVCEFEVEITPTEPKVYISYSVSYGAGEQPVNSIGQPVGAPLPSGSINMSLELDAMPALYTAEGSEQEFTFFEDEVGQGYQSVFVSEGSGTQQSFAVESSLSVVGIKTFNPLSQQWEWLGGSPTASLTHFDISVISKEQLGESKDYILYTHNQPAKGERELRIYTME